MTFAARETSISSGQPIELFDFMRRATHWRYTSTDRDMTYDSATWTAGPWQSSGFTASGDAVQQTMTITGPLDAAVAEQFLSVAPSDPVFVRVLHLHAGDTEAAVWWTGQVTNVSRKQDRIEISGESIVTAMAKLGLRLAWQKACPYSIYDTQCRLSAAAFAFDGTVSAVTGDTVSSAAFADPGNVADGRLAGGFLMWDAGDGFIERRAITAHSGDTITLLNAAVGITAGMTVTAHPGCDQSAQVCHDTFNNLDNFGGVPGLPSVSPFDQSPFV